MTLRYTVSRLARPDARRAFGRAWLWICLAGAAVTLVADGGRHFFLVLVAWLVCLFAPVRIAVEALHSVGPRWKTALQRDLRGRADRYGSAEGVALMVEWFASREVRSPRLAPPDLAPKVIEAASRLSGRLLRGGDPAGLRSGVGRCAAMLDRWVALIAAGESADADHAAASDGAGPGGLWEPNASIQEQWGTLRAVAGLAALTKILVAVSEDHAGRPLEEGAAIRREAEAAMDYVDQIGLRLDGPPWEEIAGIPRSTLAPDAAARIAGTWLEFCAGPLPAPRRLGAFLDAVTA